MAVLFKAPFNISPPPNSNHSQSVVRKQVIELENVIKDGNSEQRDLSINVNNFLLDEEAYANGMSHEYYKIKQLTLTFNYIGNWLKPKVALRASYVEDPLHIQTDRKSARPNEQHIIRVGRNHVWNVPIAPGWRYTKNSVDPRTSSFGQILLTRTPDTPDVQLPPQFEILCEMVIEYARRTIISDDVVKRTTTPYYGFQDNPDAMIKQTYADRNFVLRAKSKSTLGLTPSDKETALVFSQLPIQIAIAVRNKQDAAAEGVRHFYTTIRASNFLSYFPGASGFAYFEFETDLGSAVDFEEFWVTTIDFPQPNDYPFGNLLTALVTGQSTRTNFTTQGLIPEMISI